MHNSRPLWKSFEVNSVNLLMLISRILSFISFVVCKLRCRYSASARIRRWLRSSVLTALYSTSDSCTYYIPSSLIQLYLMGWRLMKRGRLMIRLLLQRLRLVVQRQLLPVCRFVLPQRTTSAATKTRSKHCSPLSRVTTSSFWSSLCKTCPFTVIGRPLEGRDSLPFAFTALCISYRNRWVAMKFYIRRKGKYRFLAASAESSSNRYASWMIVDFEPGRDLNNWIWSPLFPRIENFV